MEAVLIKMIGSEQLEICSDCSSPLATGAAKLKVARGHLEDSTKILRVPLYMQHRYGI